jgi:hypothetical protein
MVADIRVREEVGRVTAWPERSRKGARRRSQRKQSFALATFVQRAPIHRGPPYQRFVGRGHAGIASGCSRRIINCRLAAFALSRECEMIIAPWPPRKER